MKTIAAAAIAGILFSLANGAGAALVNVLPGDPNWSSSSNSGGGSSSISATPLLDGDGAVAINGDRTRFNISNNTAPGYGLLSNLSAFGFQWAVTQVGAGVATAQAPALRLFTFDPLNNRQIQFIWEDGEQSSPVFVNGAGSLNTAYTGNFFGPASRVYAFSSTALGGGIGRGLFDASQMLIPGSDAAQPIANLLATLNSPNTFAFSFGVGVGSSVGSDFRGFADRVTIGFGTNAATTYNFRAPGTQVPEPVSLALVGLALAAGAGVTAKRRARR
jgi:hypothetical protein